MNTPTIYRISDRAPEFPCWLWSLLENEWQQREHLIGDVDTLYDFTHWCHSETRPTVTPDECHECGGAGGVDSGGVTPWGEPISIPCPSCSSQPTPSAPDVQRVAEGIARVAEDYLEDSLGVGYLVNADGQKAIATILTRFAAELTAEKDAEIARLMKARALDVDAMDILGGDVRDLKEQLAAAQSRWLAGRDEYERVVNALAAAQEDIARLTSRNADLARLVANSQEDSRRLDWLSDNPIHKVSFGHFPNSVMFNGECFLSLRAAIDAARAKEDTRHA